MGLFGSKKPETRQSLMDKAARARDKGKRKKAVKLYQQALELSPDDHEIHARLAPVSAELGLRDQAWRSFVAAATGFHSRGFVDKAIGILRQAAGFMPQEVEVWERLADLNLQRKRPQDAIQVLREGRQKFKKKSQLSLATQLMQQAFDIEPYRFDVTMDLTALLTRGGEQLEAERLLTRLAERCEGSELRRVRGRLLRLAPSPSALGRWLRALAVGR